LKGQRIEKFHLEYWDGKSWTQFAQATTVGYKRLLSFPEVKASRIKIVIDQCRTNPTLSSFGLFMAPPEISFSKDEVSFGDTVSFSINCDTKEARIYYTTDGSLPTERSSEYKGDPVQLNNTTTVTAIAIGADGKKSIPITASFNKALYKIEYKTKLDERYPGTGVYNIVDGVKGSNDFKDGKWQGFEGKDIEAIIDLGKKQELKKLSWRFLQSLKSYIFLPKSVEFSVSDDGQNFTPIKTIVNEEPDNKDRKPFVKSFDFSPVNTSARYIYVKAVNIGPIPKWHEGAGEKAWVFTDEFIVE
ncbi:MAG: chitobiase/beta-hexosaminidase C-terminal domain-containing protein, partial [Bacteroidota bacterium]|nr:chitobiase/beta-hexosaminidase C-terminal domain-containing protein [Bacteroidota bacterium]